MSPEKCQAEKCQGQGKKCQTPLHRSMTAILDEIDEFYSPAPAILDEVGQLESPKGAILDDVEQNDNQTASD